MKSFSRWNLIKVSIEREEIGKRVFFSWYAYISMTRVCVCRLMREFYRAKCNSGCKYVISWGFLLISPARAFSTLSLYILLDNDAPCNYTRREFNTLFSSSLYIYTRFFLFFFNCSYKKERKKKNLSFFWLYTIKEFAHSELSLAHVRARGNFPPGRKRGN